jgi:hypothetical protein
MPATKPVADKLTIDQLAEMFKLPKWEDIEEMNVEYFAEAYNYGFQDGGEETALEAESKAQSEIYRQWHKAVERAAEHLFEQHELMLDPVTPRRKNSDSPSDAFHVRPSHGRTWDDAARKIMTTIEGVGMFGYNGHLKEFLASGPWTARQAVLKHLHWIKRYPDVYGTSSADSLYRDAWR